MPTYEYHCKGCAMTFDISMQTTGQGDSDPRCPKCKSEEVEPVLAEFFAVTSKKT